MLRNSLTSDLAQSVLRQSQRLLHNQSSIPRPVDDREKVNIYIFLNYSIFLEKLFQWIKNNSRIICVLMKLRCEI